MNFGNSPLSAFVDGGTHGSGVAAIIGANNILGSGGTLPASSLHMNGVLSGVPRLPYMLEVRTSRTFGIRTVFDTANDITSLTSSGVKLINISQGNTLPIFFEIPLYDPQKEKILTNHDVLFVIAAGNDGQNADGLIYDTSPAMYGNFPNVITVGAVNNSDERMSPSNFGDMVSISAPGDAVYVPRSPFVPPLDIGDYGTLFYTSAAAPLVTGVAGLLLAINPTLTPAELKTILTKEANTDPITTEADKPIGRRLNAHKAVCDSAVLNCTLAVTASLRGRVNLHPDYGPLPSNSTISRIRLSDVENSHIAIAPIAPDGTYHFTPTPGKYLLHMNIFIPFCVSAEREVVISEGEERVEDLVLVECPLPV